MFIAAAGFVAVLHVLFGLGETVGWDQMSRRLGFDKEKTETTRVLALNQGAYNAGVACLLGWSLAMGHTATSVALLVFVLAMSVVGALSVRWTLFVGQGVPALIALGVWAAGLAG